MRHTSFGLLASSCRSDIATTTCLLASCSAAVLGRPTCCDWCTAIADATSENSTKQVMPRWPRFSLICRKPGCELNRLRISFSSVCNV